MRGQSGGFTLAEILVVLALASILAMVAMPYIRFGARSSSPDAVARNIADVLASARAEAMKSGRSQPVYVSIIGPKRLKNSNGTTLFELPEGYELEAEGVGRAATETDASFVFLPSGESTGGAIALIHGMERRNISVNWITGHVAVEKPERSP